MNNIKVLKFSADWCVKCIDLSNEIEQADVKFKHNMQNIDIDIEDDIAKQYNIKKVPAIIFVDNNGTKLKQLNGKIDGTLSTELIEKTYTTLVNKNIK